MKADESTTIAELKQQVAAFVAERDWQRYHDPKNLSMAIAIEAAELMEHFQWLRSEELQSALADPAMQNEVRDELADIACFMLALSSRLNIDLAQAIEDKMAKNRKKYPAAEFRGNYRKPKAQ